MPGLAFRHVCRLAGLQKRLAGLLGSSVASPNEEMVIFPYWEKPQGSQSDPILALPGSSVASPNEEMVTFPSWEKPQRSQSEPILALPGSSVASPAPPNSIDLAISD